MTHRRTSPGLWLTLVILLLAAGLRLLWLDARALWFDEGVSLTFARFPLSDILRFHILWQDTNPPAYRVLLGGWLRLMGTTAFTARLLSVWLGVLCVALSVRLARMLRVGHGASLLTALLMAAAPMQVYYSREVKHYVYVQFFLLLLAVLWLRWFPLPPRQMPQKGPRWRAAMLWSASVLATALAVGAHYMAGLAVAVMAAGALIWGVAARRKGADWRPVAGRVLGWLAGQAIAGGLWLPWVLATVNSTIAGARTAAVNAGLAPRGPLAYFGGMLLEFASGPVGPEWARGGLAVLLAGAALAGLVHLWRNQPAGWLALAWLAGPLLLGLAAQRVIVFFLPRFLLYAMPALALLAGAGMSALRRGEEMRLLAREIIAGLPIATLALSGALLWSQYNLPDPAPDLRPLAADLAEQMQPGDALIYSYSWQPGMLAAYLPEDRQPVYYASFFEPGTLEESLQAILDRHKRVWLLTYEIGADNPINDVGLWLLAHSASPGGTWYGESQLSLFIAPEQAHNPGPPRECADMDGGRITLCFAPLEGTPELEPATPLVLALSWQASVPLEERYVVFVHVLGPDSPVPVAQQDGEPVNGLHPTYTWLPDQPVIDLHAVNLPPELAAQDRVFEVRVGLYDGDTLERVPVDGGGDSVLIGSFRLAEPGEH